MYLLVSFAICRTGLRATNVVTAGDLVPAGPVFVTPDLKLHLGTLISS